MFDVWYFTRDMIDDNAAFAGIDWERMYAETIGTTDVDAPLLCLPASSIVSQTTT